jgi:isoquinoline 1-oxidoreductase alpha subunit
MQAASLLATNANPTDADIDSAMGGNLCRCMAYTRIKKAIKMAASHKALANNVGAEVTLG